MTSRFVATVGGGSGGGDGGGDGGVENGKGGCGTGTWYGYVVRVRGAGTWPRQSCSQLRLRGYTDTLSKLYIQFLGQASGKRLASRSVFGQGLTEM